MKFYTEKELKDYASQESKTIVIRTYTDGNSSDDRRESTETEKKILEAVIFGGLLQMNGKVINDEVIGVCEYIGDILIPHMNGFDSIYQPLKLANINIEKAIKTSEADALWEELHHNK